VTLDPLSCVIQEFLDGIATLFRGTPRYSYAIVNCIGNRAGCARSLVSRFGDVIGRSFQYSLRHGMLLRNLPAERPVLKLSQCWFNDAGSMMLFNDVRAMLSNPVPSNDSDSRQEILCMPMPTLRVNHLNGCPFLYILCNCRCHDDRDRSGRGS
jgi:hypothetical protein